MPAVDAVSECNIRVTIESCFGLPSSRRQHFSGSA
jgi:hypothetical protein